MQWRGSRVQALALGVALVVAAVGCGGDGGGGGGELQGLVRTPPLSVGAVTLPEVAADGSATPFSFAAPAGHVLVTYFGYTNCPDLCPTTMADLRTALGELGDDAGRVDVAFVTVDPERDTPDKVGAYLGSFFARGIHPIRTEDPAALAVAEDAFLATSSVTTNDEGRVEVSHTGITYVIDPSGTVQVEWPFGTSPDAMASDLRIVLDRVPAAGADTQVAALPLTFSGAWARASAADADNGAAYLTITSNEAVDDTITAVAVDPAVAEMAEVHRTAQAASGAMTMAPAGDLVVPAGGTVALEPGGLHVMLMGLKKPLVDGDRFALTLTFAEAGRQEVSVEVKDQR